MHDEVSKVDVVERVDAICKGGDAMQRQWRCCVLGMDCNAACCAFETPSLYVINCNIGKDLVKLTITNDNPTLNNI